MIMLFADLETMLDRELKLTDIIQYPELFDFEVVPSEPVIIDEDGFPTGDELNQPHKVWEWIRIMADMAEEVKGYTEKEYKELMEANFEEA